MQRRHILTTTMLLIGADDKPEGRDDDYGDGHGASYTTSALQARSC